MRVSNDPRVLPRQCIFFIVSPFTRSGYVKFLNYVAQLKELKETI